MYIEIFQIYRKARVILCYSNIECDQLFNRGIFDFKYKINNFF